MKTLSDSDRAWIRSLGRSEGGSSGSVMSEADEARLVELVREHGLPCTMFSSAYGFAISVYDLPNKSGEAPRCLANMTGYLAFPPRGTTEADQCRHLASLLTHTPENAEVLSYYGMEPQRKDFLDHCY